MTKAVSLHQESDLKAAVYTLPNGGAGGGCLRSGARTGETVNSEREPVRCNNPECPSAEAGGRILIGAGRAMYFVKQKIRSGQDVDVTFMGPWVTAVCPSCKRPRINPDLVAADGVAGAITRALEPFAERVNVELESADEAPERKPRDRLRRVA